MPEKLTSLAQKRPFFYNALCGDYTVRTFSALPDVEKDTLAYLEETEKTFQKPLFTEVEISPLDHVYADIPGYHRPALLGVRIEQVQDIDIQNSVEIHTGQQQLFGQRSDTIML